MDQQKSIALKECCVLEEGGSGLAHVGENRARERLLKGDGESDSRKAIHGLSNVLFQAGASRASLQLAIVEDQGDPAFSEHSEEAPDLPWVMELERFTFRLVGVCRIAIPKALELLLNACIDGTACGDQLFESEVFR